MWGVRQKVAGVRSKTNGECQASESELACKKADPFDEILARPQQESAFSINDIERVRRTGWQRRNDLPRGRESSPDKPSPKDRDMADHGPGGRAGSVDRCRSQADGFPLCHKLFL